MDWIFLLKGVFEKMMSRGKEHKATYLGKRNLGGALAPEAHTDLLNAVESSFEATNMDVWRVLQSYTRPKLEYVNMARKGWTGTVPQ
jgi:hypothetical protein